MLVSKEMLKWFKTMKIDERKEILDISDHNLIQVSFQDEKRVLKDFRQGVWEEIKYYTTDKVALEKFTKSVEENLIKGEERNQITNITELNRIMKEVAELRKAK